MGVRLCTKEKQEQEEKYKGGEGLKEKARTEMIGLRWRLNDEQGRGSGGSHIKTGLRDSGKR